MERELDKKFQVNPLCCRNLVSFGYLEMSPWISVPTKSDSLFWWLLLEPWFSKPLHGYVSRFQHTSPCPRYPANLFDGRLLTHGIGSDAQALHLLCSAFTCSDKRTDRNVLSRSVVKLTVISALFPAKVLQGFIQTTQETRLVPLVRSIGLGLQRVVSRAPARSESKLAATSDLCGGA